MKNSLQTLATAMVVAWLFSGSTYAATSTWTGPSGDDWSTAGDWSPSGVPAATNIASFNTNISSVTNTSNQSIAGITFDTSAGSITIGSTSGGHFTLASTGTIQMLNTLTGTGLTETINAPLVIGSGSTAATYTIANNYTDNTSTLVIGGTITGGTTSTTTLTLSGANTGANTISGAISNGSSSSLGISKSGTGTWILSGANSYTGSTSVSGGTLQIGNGTSGSIGSGGLSTSAGGTLAFNEANGSTIANAITNAGTVNGAENGSVTNTLSGIISGAGAVTQTGAGTTILSAVNTFTGAVTVTGGSLQLNNANAIATASLVNINSTNGLTFGTGIGTFNTLALSGTGNESLQDTGGGAVTLSLKNFVNQANGVYSGVLSGTGGVTRIASIQFNNTSGVETFTGANTFTGATTINGGVINYQNGTALGTFSAITVNTSAGGGGTVQVQGNIAGGSQILTLAGTGVQNANNGALENISGNNSYAGNINLSTNAAIDSDTGALTLSGNITNTLATGTATLTLEGSSTSANTISGSISDGGSAFTALSKTGTGNWVLSNANSFTGATTISGGTLELDNANALASSATTTINSANGLTFGPAAGGTFFLVNLAGTANESLQDTSGGAITLSATNTSASTYSGILSGIGGLTQGGPGTLTLTGANTFTGATLVNGGGLINYQNSTAFGTNSAITVTAGSGVQVQGGIAGGSQLLTLAGAGPSSNGALENVSGNNSYAGNIVLTGSTTIGSDAGTLTLTGNLNGGGFLLKETGTGTVDLAGIVSGSGNFQKLNTGTLIFAGANTFTGTTTFSGTGGIINYQNGTAFGTNSAITVAATGDAVQVQGGIAGGSKLLALAGTGVNSNGALENVSGNNSYAGVVNLTAATTIGVDAGTLTLNGGLTDGTNVLTVTGPGNLTIATTGITGSVATGTIGLIKNGVGTLTLSAANTATGIISESAGIIDLQTATGGSLIGTNGLSFATGLGGTFNYDNTGATGVQSQSMGALTYSTSGTGGEGTVISTLGSATSATLTFTGPVGRGTGVGSTLNFITSGGTNGTTNSIDIAGQALGFINAATFFNGSNYAYMDAAGTFVRGINYGTDPNSGVSTGGTTLASNYTGTAVGSGVNVEITGAITADTTTSIKTLEIAGASNFTQSGSTLALTGILKSGGNAATISGGNLTTSATTTDLVVRTDASGDVLTIADAITGTTGGLTKSGAGTLILTGTNTNTGNTYINGGTLQVGNGGTTGNINLTSSVIDNGLFVYDNTTGATQSGIISGSGGLTVAGGKLILSSASSFSYTGQTTINSGGTLQVGNATTGNISSANNITDNGTLAYNLSATATYSGIISGTGSLVQMAANVLTLLGTNTYSGTTTINTGGTIAIGTTATTTASLGSGNVVDNGTLNILNGGTTTLSNNISGAGALNLSGGVGTLILSGNNTYLGNTSLNGTTIVASNSAFGTGTVTLGGGTIESDGNAHTISNAITLGASETLGNGGNLTFTGPMTVTANSTFTLTMRNAGTTTFGAINLSATSTGKNLTIAPALGGATTIFAGPIVATGLGNPSLTIVYGATASTIELSGNNALETGVTLSGSASGYLMIGNDNAFGGKSFAFNPTAGQIILIEADPNSTETLSNGLTGQILGLNNNITTTTSDGLGGSGNLQFNGTVSATFNNQSTGTTIFHNTITGGISGEGTGAVVLDASSTYTSFGWSDGNSTLTLSGTSSGNLSLVAGTAILDTGNTLLHLAAASTLTLNGVNLELANISSTSSNVNQTSATTNITGGQTTISQVGGSTATIALGSLTAATSSAYSGGDIDFVNAIGATAGNNNGSAVATTTAGNANGLLMPGAAVVTSGQANIADWATVSSNNIVAFSSYTPFATSGSSTTAQYGLTGSSATTGSLSAQTLKITSTAAGQSLNLTNGGLTFNGSTSFNLYGGGGLLYVGANNYTITGGSIGAATGILNIQQFGTGNLTIASNLGSPSTTYLIKGGPGTLTLTGTGSTYLGQTIVNQGVLSISSDSNLNPIFSGTLNNPATSSMASSTVNLANQGIPTSNTGFAIGTTVLGQIVVGINASNNVLFLSGNANAVVTNVNTTFINDPGIILNGGTLQATSTFNLASQIGGTGAFYGRSIGLGNDNGTIDVTGNNVLTISGIIYGGGALTKIDTGTLLLTNPYNNYTGGTTVTGGILEFGVSNALNNVASNGSFQQALTNPVLVNGGTIDLAGTTQDLGPLTLSSGSIIDSVGGGVINAYSYALQSGSVDAVLADNAARNSGAGVGLNAAVTKTTSGSVFLDDANTYTGGTSVTGGTLYANNTSGSGTGFGAVNVGNGGTLAGSGAIRPNLPAGYGVTVATGGMIAPGGVQPAPILTPNPVNLANGNLTLDPTNVISGNLLSVAQGSNSAPSFSFALGSSHSSSQILVAGSTANVINFNLGGTSGPGGTSSVISINDLIGGGLALNTNYVLIAGNGNTIFEDNGVSLLAAGDLGATVVGHGQIIIGGLSLLAANTPGNSFSNIYAGSLLFLNGDNIEVEVIPEPGTWAMMIGGFALLILLQRRKRKLS